MCPLVGEQLNDLCYTHTIEDYSGIKRGINTHDMGVSHAEGRPPISKGHMLYDSIEYLEMTRL